MGTDGVEALVVGVVGRDAQVVVRVDAERILVPQDVLLQDELHVRILAVAETQDVTADPGLGALVAFVAKARDEVLGGLAASEVMRGRVGREISGVGETDVELGGESNRGGVDRDELHAAASCFFSGLTPISSNSPIPHTSAMSARLNVGQCHPSTPPK